MSVTSGSGAILLGGVLLVVAGVWLPRDWYDALPRQPLLREPPPVKGVTLLQACIVIEGLVLAGLGLSGWRPRRAAPGERLSIAVPRDAAGDVGASSAKIALGLITLLGVVLRTVQLGSDLWLDEITPVLEYGSLSPLQVVGTFLSTNNHLLNTLLVNASVALFGEREWAIRLPAMLFGAATIPALYWLARTALSRRTSLWAALLLAVSYHHVFFSQNARGYSAYVCLSLLASGLLIRALQEDRAGLWVLYVAAMVLDAAAQLITVFVLAAHGIVALLALAAVRSRGASPRPLFGHAAAAFAAVGFLAFQLYAVILPDAYLMMQVVYTRSSSGYAFSGALVQELQRGLSAGFAAGLLALLPFLAVAALGFVLLLRRHWALALTLALPGLLNAAFILVRGLTFSPRFFLLALPLTVLAAVNALDTAAAWLARRAGSARLPARLATAALLALAALSLASLRHYYTVPKQPYRASLQYLAAARQPGDMVIVVDVAEKGFRYYGARFGLRDGEDCFYVRSLDALREVTAAHPGRRSFLLSTFPRALHLRFPELEAAMRDGWAIEQTFPATIGDGQISVWRQRTA